MVIYLSGAITDIPDGNRPAFERAAAMLRQAGYQVVNPHDIPPAPWRAHDGENSLWQRHMRADVKVLVDCDRIAMLPGWDQSDGAKLEHFLAAKLGIGAIYLQWEAQAVV